MEPIELDADAGDPMEILVVQRHDTRETFTRYRLQETLMLMGCRPRDAVSVTNEVFAVFHKHLAHHNTNDNSDDAAPTNSSSPTPAGDKEENRLIGPVPPPEPFALPWHYLHQCIYSTLTRLDYTKPHHLLDFQVAKEITQRNQSFVVLLGGTSGTGKSTLAALLAARLRLTTVLPTDSVRHILRAFTSKEENPCAFVSTYQAGDALSDTAVVKELLATSDGVPMSAHRLHKRKVLKGYKLQSELVLEKLDRVLTMFERRQQSLVVEGVHLNTDQMAELVKRHPNCVPFVIYISNELKHRERFAVRARHMTIDPQENKYIKYFDNIRIIQRHLCKHADKFLIPKIDNTNVDRSIATILSTLIRVLRKMDRGEKIFDDKINKMVLLSREHENSIKKAWSSKTVRKAMRPLIKQKVAKRLLLRRLLAEQSMAIFGAAPHEHDGEDSSSSDDERQHDDLFQSADDADVEDEEDEQTTVVGSLFSGTNGRNSLTGSVSRGRAFLDEIEQNHAVDSRSAKLMRSLSAAIQQASLWRASQPLSKYSDWEAFVVPSRGSDATFSEVIETFHATPGYSEMKHKWKQDERRKSWMPGDVVDTNIVQGLPPKSSLRAMPPSRSTRELETPQKHISFAPMANTTSSGGGHPFRRTRRVQSLPPDALDTSSVDFDLDSVSVAGHDDEDRLSQASSRRDECISPLAQSAEDTDSHFEISSQSSEDGDGE